MKKLLYRDDNCLDDAFIAIRSNETFTIVFTGWRSRVLNKSIPLYMKYFYEKEKRNKRKKKIEILQFAPFGMLTPSFWGIISKAVMNNMEFDYEQRENLLEVKIIPSK